MVAVSSTSGLTRLAAGLVIIMTGATVLTAGWMAVAPARRTRPSHPPTRAPALRRFVDA